MDLKSAMSITPGSQIKVQKKNSNEQQQCSVAVSKNIMPNPLISTFLSPMHGL